MSLAEDILRTMKLEEMLTNKISVDIDYSEGTVYFTFNMTVNNEYIWSVNNFAKL